MKKFLRNILIFVLPVILMAYPFDLLISNQLKKSNTFALGEYTTWNDLFDGNINADLVVYGSSRARVHFDPTMLEKKLELSAYNLGIEGHNFWLQYLRHKLLLKYNKKPKVILLSLDVFTFQKRENLYNPDQLLPYMLFNDMIQEYSNCYNGFAPIDYQLPLIRFFGKAKAINQAIKNTFNKTNPNLGRIKGFKANEQVWNEDLLNAKKKLPFYEVIYDISLIDLFESFLKECEQERIKVILVYSPQYIEGQRFVKNRKELIRFFENYAEKFQLPFLNYSGDAICKDKTYFYNASHLNKKGAEIFTNKLILDLKDTNLLGN